MNDAIKKSDRRTQHGFTLLEVMMSVFIFAMLSLGLISLVSGILTQSNKQSILLADEDAVRRIEFGFTSQIRNANIGNNGAYPIGAADDQDITFYSDISGSGSLTFTRVRYYLQNKTLYEATTAPTGLVYNNNNEVVTPVISDVANAANQPLFYYYDDTYNGTTNVTPLTQPVNINSVKYIQIRLIIANKAGVTNTNTYTITDGAAIRNLKTNLGN